MPELTNLTVYDFTLRHVVNAGLSVFSAAIVNFYFFQNSECWLLLSAFIMSQAARTAPLRQAMVCFSIIMMAILASTWLKETAYSFYFLYLSVSFLFLVCNYFLFTASSSAVLFYTLIFFTIFLSSSLMPSTSFQVMPARIIELAIGAAIGFIPRFIFPLKFEAEFSYGMVPVLKKLHEYSSLLTNFLIVKDNEQAVLDKKNELEKLLNAESHIYPEWVYEAGFNRGLRAGLRYFLIHLERAIELFFSIQLLAFQNIDIPHGMQDLIQTAMQKNEELLVILQHYFENKHPDEIKSNFTADIVSLENALQQILPQDRELLDISPLYLQLITLVRNIKDLRELLLQLVLALPAPQNERKNK